MKETSQANRTVMAIVAVIAGLLCTILIPSLVQTSLEGVLTNLIKVSAEKPQYSSGIALFSLFYPIWRALIFVAGITLLLIAVKIYQGEEWTYPVSLLAYAIPSVGGFFMFLPHISWVPGFPVPLAISFIGLVGYAVMILMRAGKWSDKLIEFGTLVFLGMSATHSFTLGVGSLRMLMVRPGKPLFQDISFWILSISGEVVFIAFLLIMIAIPLIALRKGAGWWLAMIATVATLAINTPTQIIRSSTNDYLYGALLALGSLFFLLLPAFLSRRAVESAPGEIEPAPEIEAAL